MFFSLKQILARFRNKADDARITVPLTQDEISALDTLRAEPGFDILLKVLDQRIKFNAESLLDPNTTSEKLHYQRGFLAGLRSAGTLVDEIIAQHDHRSQQSDHIRRANERDERRARLVHANSPYWS